jgi:hypothetical protein
MLGKGEGNDGTQTPLVLPARPTIQASAWPPLARVTIQSREAIASLNRPGYAAPSPWSLGDRIRSWGGTPASCHQSRSVSRGGGAQPIPPYRADRAAASPDGRHAVTDPHVSRRSIGYPSPAVGGDTARPSDHTDHRPIALAEGRIAALLWGADTPKPRISRREETDTALPVQ